MKKNILLSLTCLCLISPAIALAGGSPEEKAYYEVLKEDYIPQSTPEESFLLELKLLEGGMYCYDLPLFDPQWRLKGKKILTSPLFSETAKAASQPFQTYIEGRYAVIYYPNNENLSPVFLYEENSKWIIDRTASADRVFFDHGRWVTLGGDYPYLSLLKKVYRLKEIDADKSGASGYRMEDKK